MTLTGRYPGFRAPQGDGEVLSVPSEIELPNLVEKNRQRPELDSTAWFGHPLREIAHRGRAELLRAAVAYTSQYADVDAELGTDGPLVVTGHQAELFHPGVWLKNFYAAEVARQCGGIGLNLIIDSDLCRRPAIQVPSGFASEVRIELVPYDKALTEVPFEERLIVDREQWATFGSRVSKALHNQVASPLIDDWWPSVVGASRREGNLGLALSQARHERERQWGSLTLELPQSRICQSEAFRLFALELFRRAADFREAHNRSLHDYRAAHKLRNHAQPMPNLAQRDGWIEAPFWLWSRANAQRRSVFVHRSGEELTISDLGQRSLALPLQPGLATERLAQWEGQGIKLRTRALATTLFARLVLADLFIHGIGGAKYDQVTDHICELFWGFALPKYATVSGTLRLPLSVAGQEPESEATLRQQLWSLRYHPERHLAVTNESTGAGSAIDQLIAEKRKWMETAKTRENAAERHRAIKEANERLRPYLAPRRLAVEKAIAQAKLACKIEQLRRSREYAYCLFSESRLRKFFAL